MNIKKLGAHKELGSAVSYIVFTYIYISTGRNKYKEGVYLLQRKSQSYHTIQHISYSGS